MSVQSLGIPHGRLSRRREVWQFRAILALTYPFFLLAVLIGRLLPARYGFWPRGAEGRPSVFAAALIAANTTIPFVFMG